MKYSFEENPTDAQDTVTATGMMEMVFKIEGGRIYLMVDITEAVAFYNAESAGAKAKARSDAEAAFKKHGDADA